MYRVRYVTIAKFTELTGLTEDMVNSYRKNGHWADGVQYKKDPAGRIKIDLEEYDKWVEQHYRKELRYVAEA